MGLKKSLFGFIAFILILLTLWGMSEAVIYLLFKKEVVTFPRYLSGAQYGEYSLRRNIPNAEYFHKSYDGQWDFKINAQGFRNGHNIPYEKKGGGTRILLLGDSFTIGYEVSVEQTFGAILERILREKGYAVEVLNAGVSGFSNAEEWIYFREEGLKFHPDVVIVSFFKNDLEDNVRTDLFRLKNGVLVENSKAYLPFVKERVFLNSFSLYRWLNQHSYLHSYLNNVATLYLKDKIKSENEAMILEMKRSEAAFKDIETYEKDLAVAILQQIKFTAEKNKVHVILMEIPTFKLEPSILSNVDLSKICDDYFDTWLLLSQFTGLEPLYRLHGHRHWTEKAHEIAAEGLAERIVPVIKKRIQQQKLFS